jgi:hypothetical protein
VNFLEPPSTHTSLVLIGRNKRGQWVAQERNGLFGGLFTHRVAALRYALFENGHHPEAILAMDGVLELDMAARPFVGDTARAA